jgi:CRISPR-associated protein Cas6
MATQKIGIHPLHGRLGGQRTILLRKHSHLTIRLPADLIRRVLPLAGQTLEINGLRLLVGAPRVRALTAAQDLYSRLVVIKGMLEPDTFLKAARSRMDTMGVVGEVRLARRQTSRAMDPLGTGGRGEWVRRTLQVKERHIVGYALEVRGLSSEDSIRLQSNGLGGRRRFGCGIFVPARIAEK